MLWSSHWHGAVPRARGVSPCQARAAAAIAAAVPSVLSSWQHRQQQPHLRHSRVVHCVHAALGGMRSCWREVQAT
jgi:hypothetical protein